MQVAVDKGDEPPLAVVVAPPLEAVVLDMEVAPPEPVAEAAPPLDPGAVSPVLLSLAPQAAAAIPSEMDRTIAK